MSESHDVAGVVAPPPIIFAAGLAVGLLANRAIALPKVPPRLARIVAAGLLGGVAACGPPAFLKMRSMQTSVDPYEPTTAIVETGPFRFTRNPLYLSMAMLYTAIALLARATLPLMLLPGILAVVQRGVIEREERYLERKFGVTYLAYKARVRRWI